MKKDRTLVLSILLLVLIAPLHGCVSDQQPADQLGTVTIKAAGIHNPITVQRDERGVPYIEARDENDLYFAQGYVVAADRLWQMELLRRTGRGELSDLLGKGTLEDDKRFRALGFASVAEQMLSRMESPMRATLESYTRGVNAFIESLDEKSLPPEFRVLRIKPRPWQPSDSLVIGKLFAETLSTTWQVDLMRAALANLPKEKWEPLLPSTSPLDLILVGSDRVDEKTEPSGLPASGRSGSRASLEILRETSELAETRRRSLERVGLYAEDLAASNNWVVSGQHTVTGKPLLANDPHLAPSAPSLWYMVHLSAPGLRVAGVTVAGTPGVIVGHNERIAWGITNVEGDVQDLYIEKFDESNPRRYLTPDGWRDAEVRHEEIKVRKSRDSVETDSVAFDVTVTRHGPIILEKDGVRYAVAWTALDTTSSEFERYYAMNRARNWQEFSAALSAYTGFPLNYVYADVDGHIGFWAAGRYPIRKTGSGTVPSDGSTDAGDWIGYVPFEKTPHVYDPPSGIIVTANNRLIGRDYPYYLGNAWAAPYRARRVYDLLTAKPKLTVEDFRAIQSDTYSFPDATFTAEVVKLARPLAADSSEWQDLLTSFEGWDARIDAESRVLPLATYMRQVFQRRLIVAALGDQLAPQYSWPNSGTFFDNIITKRPPEWLPQGYDSYDTLLLECYHEARDSLKKKLGPDPSQWIWKRLAQVRFPHPLASQPLIGSRFAIEPIPQNGGWPAVNRGGSVSMRYIADLSNWDNTRQGIPLGESGDPSSSHWKDQMSDWQAVDPRAFPFTKAAVASSGKIIKFNFVVTDGTPEE